MSEKYRGIYLEAYNNFLEEKLSSKDIDNLYEVMETMESSSDTDYLLLVEIYSFLKYHKKAYQLLLRKFDKNNKSQRKLLGELKIKADYYEDRMSIKRTTDVQKSFIGSMPIFKYCKKPIKSEMFEIGGTEVCDCCGKEVDVYYDGAVYCIKDVDNLCPECIHNGKAAEKFDAEFQQDTFNDENILDESCREELLKRTPSYISWQGSNWPAHCGDYCEFIDIVGWNELKEIECEKDFINFTGYEINELEDYLFRHGSMCGYLFRCLKCGKYCLCADCD